MHIFFKMYALQPKCECKCDPLNVYLLQNKCTLQLKYKCKCDPQMRVPNILFDFSQYAKKFFSCIVGRNMYIGSMLMSKYIHNFTKLSTINLSYLNEYIKLIVWLNKKNKNIRIFW